MQDTSIFAFLLATLFEKAALKKELTNSATLVLKNNHNDHAGDLEFIPCLLNNSKSGNGTRA